MKASTKAIRFLKALKIPEGPKADLIVVPRLSYNRPLDEKRINTSWLSNSCV